ncbi:N-acetylneuraminate synthase [Peptoanaerobacter stomatis]|jgi:N-acetylneuraminate synthase|uniref:N-acetylneuraminate synthase n=1 Tax=Peptoanaerobacter stomatis TaxID=796937 RepID=J6HHI8_9FIRM|nr:N-acetylneuraminate synthase [Peptoanaerobacter stomatis]EJU22118.1 N-acetylneuraminate synthase [Peptoanaerobacter stomatis]NWO24922.1 N-acetylneuraminate synthase [Peptostreptococcaceae bacterium oral taxon 081]
MGVFIIAEAGVNHNGSLKLAKKLVDEAKNAGVDCIKFQTFIAENIVSKTAVKAEYQKQNTNNSCESQYNMLKKLELSFSDFIELNNYCKAKNIQFLSTAFDFESIDFLSSLDMNVWKIPSGEITNLPYLIKIANLGKDVIISTGMSTMEDIQNALSVLKTNGAGNITVLHCTTEYPAPFADVNLKAMLTIKDKFDVNIGYSDHTKGIEIPISAVALGATVIEKHFTLDKNMQGPDHKASLEPHELKKMVESIRNVESALGDGIKKLAESEKKNISVARKSIIAKRDIKKGEIFTQENLTVKRPGNGISPMKWFEILGQKAIKDFKEDELIEI